MADEEIIGLSVRMATADLDRDVAVAQSKIARLSSTEFEIHTNLKQATSDLDEFAARVQRLRAELGQGTPLRSLVEEKAYLESIYQQKQKLAALDEAERQRAIVSPSTSAALPSSSPKLLELNQKPIKLPVELETKAAEERLLRLKDVISGIGQGVGQAGINVVVNSVQQAGGFVASTTLQFEKFNTVLRTLFGDADKADAAFQGIEKFAKDTPFQLDEVLGSFIKLKNRGFDPTNESLTKLGDLASSQGKSLDKITDALLAAQTGEFEQLRGLGIEASQSGEKATFTFKGLTQVVANTPEGIGKAVLKLGEMKGIAGGMEAQSKTLGGQLSNLQDEAAKIANTFGKELIPVLSELVKGFLAGGGDAEQLARELGQNTAEAIRFLGDVLKAASDNSKLLEIALQLLIARFVALRAIALYQILVEISAGLIATGTAAGASSTGIALATGALTNLKVAMLANLPLLLAVGGAVAAIQTFQFVDGIVKTNEALSVLQTSTYTQGGATQVLAGNTKQLTGELTEQIKKTGELSAAQKKQAADQIKLNQQQLTDLKKQLKESEQTPESKGGLFGIGQDEADAQNNARKAAIADTKVQIASLEGQTNALKKATGVTGEDTEATKKNAVAKQTLKDKISAISDATSSRISQATNEEAQALAKIADSETASGSNKAEVEARKLQATQARIGAELAAENDRLEKLKALAPSKDEKEEKDRLKALEDSNQKIGQLELQSSQNRAQQRQQAEHAALEAIVKANEDAEKAITTAQNDRLAHQKQLLLNGQISEEQCAVASAKIAESAAEKLYQSKAAEFDKIEQARKAGTISAETAAKEEKTINEEIGKANLARIDAEIQAQRALRAERVKAIQSAAEDRKAPIEQATSALGQRDTTLKNEDDLLSARLRTTNALAGLEQQRLQFALDNAKAAGNTVVAGQIQEQLFASQTAQLAEQQRVRLEITKSENEQKLNQAQIAVNQAEINVLTAQEAVSVAEAEGKSKAEIARLQRKADLAGQILEQTKQGVGFQQQINAETDKAITAEDQAAKEKLTQQQQQSAKEKELHTQKIDNTKKQLEVDKAANDELQSSREKGIDRQLQLEFATSDRERERLKQQFDLEDRKAARRAQLEAPIKAQAAIAANANSPGTGHDFNGITPLTQGSGKDFGPVATVKEAGASVQSKTSAPAPMQGGFDASIDRLGKVFSTEIGGLKETLIAVLNSPRSLTVNSPAAVPQAAKIWRDISNQQVGGPGGV